jgi:hypothetical protein
MESLLVWLIVVDGLKSIESGARVETAGEGNQFRHPAATHSLARALGFLAVRAHRFAFTVLETARPF